MKIRSVLIIVLLAGMYGNGVMAQEKPALTKDTSNTIALLLSQTVHELTPDILSDHVRRWNAPSIHYKIIGSEDPEPVEQSFATLSQLISEANPHLSFAKSDDTYDADILVVQDKVSSSLFAKYGIDLKRFYSVDGQYLSDQLIANISHLFDSDINPCVWFEVHDRFEIKKSIIFSAQGQSLESASRCINGALVATLGLSRELVPGHTVRSSTEVNQSQLTQADKVALQLLYQPNIAPGSTVEDVLSNAAHIKLVAP